MDYDSDSDSCPLSSASSSSGRSIAIKPYWTVEEGNDSVVTLNTNKGTATCVAADSPIVVRVPTKRRVGPVIIKKGHNHVETLRENFKFRITPSKTEKVTLEVPLKDGTVSLLLVRNTRLE
jgi:hypothetical protein